MRRVMKIFLSSLLFGIGISGSAFAFSPDFHLGMESDFSRKVVTPATFPFIDAGLNSSEENSKVDLELKMSLQHPKVFGVASRNLYYEISDSDAATSTFHFAFGRKWINWSELDEDWGLGVSNPLFAWDRLRSFSQGLTGIFMNADSKNIHFDFFASYLFLPETEPNVVIENNEFASDHPQAVTAGPQTFDLLNHPTPLGYNLIIPKMNTIILRPSVLLSLETRQNIAPLFGKFSFGYLPLNYFPVAMQATLAIPIDQGVVVLRPRLLSHEFYDAELSYAWSQSFTNGFSVIVDKIFSEESLPADYTTATLGTTTYWSPWIRFESLKLSYLFSQGGVGSDVGPWANPSQNLFSSRILYRNAIQLQTNYKELTSKILHEFSINANWIALDWSHPWSNHFNTTLGGDVISAQENSAASGGAEFLSDLRALDRIRIGVNYVF